MSAAHDIYSVVKPLLIFSKVFGLYPNTVENFETQQLTSPWSNGLDIVWSATIMIFLTFYSIYTMRMGEKPATSTELIVEIGDIIYMSVSLIDAFLLSLFSITKRTKMVQFLQKFANFEKKMQQLDLPLDLANEYTRAKVCVLFAIATAISLIISYVIIDIILFLGNVTFEDIGAEIVAYVYPLVTMMTMVMQFCTLCLLTRQKFRWINLKLDQIRKQWQGKNKTTYYSNKIKFVSPKETTKAITLEKLIYFLEQFRRRHYELCSLTENLNRIFNVQILFTCLNLFITITFTVYFYFISNSDAKIRSPVLYSTYYALNGFINVSALFGLVWAASQTKNEAKHTSRILHKIYDRNEEVENSIMHFSFQLLQSNVEFSGCHVFVLDETLLFSVVGAITTYLVIVIQFQYQN
nr:PREDICTED: putative gustatory receptor 28b isoform X1 [Tribolium castaneum]XP_015840752.1 PREDICTED: putative gustatory receptor 28b isoform X1 [Tribolium castaneum]XP_015840753.1 PREDICTED: putative gustatory receptor 28b isoform X1 [Tribolium castaneum]|eukprot:XP_015840750.1 PREDICTED: putative gustatory receptor 28b isoform X1 [Tribolium castaneum]